MSIVEINSKYDVDLEGIHFCIRALDLKDRRAHISHLMVSKGFMYATDGRRLHRYELKRTLKPGLYRILKKLKNDVVIAKTEFTIKENYPKISHIIDVKGHKKIAGQCHKDDYILTMTQIIRLLPEDRAINPEFLKDINEYSCDVFLCKDMVSITTQDKKAILMHMKG